MMEEDLIRRYFKGELSDTERVEVELRQLEDTEFASMMIQFKETRNGIRLAKKEELKDRLREIETQRKSKGRIRKFAIAASIAVILGIGVMLIWNQSMGASDNLYAEYYEPYPNVYAPITREGDSLSALDQAFANYEQGKYKKALLGFDSELEVNDNQDVLFYKAIALIQLGQEKKAQETLTSIRAGESGYRPQILWYESLLFIKDEQFAKAKSKLIELDKLNSGYKTQTVKELIKEL